MGRQRAMRAALWAMGFSLVLGGCKGSTVEDASDLSDAGDARDAGHLGDAGDAGESCEALQLPQNNLVANPSFESDTAGWTSWQGSLSRLPLDCGAGAYVARAEHSAGSQYSLDDTTPTVEATQAGTYAATAWVRAASPSADGKPVSLVIRQRDSGGAQVGWISSPSVALSGNFQKLSVSAEAVAGNALDLYVIQSDAVAGDAFYADALGLTFTPAVPPTCAANRFTVQYFNNSSLSGTPVREECEDAIDHAWGTGSPGTGVNADVFSAQWIGSPTFAADTYEFTATVDDGIRVFVDGAMLIDQWKDQTAATYKASKALTAGAHEIKVQYYENTGPATLKLTWTAASVSPSPSGEAMPVGDLPGWKQVFTDDFTTDVPLGSFPAAVSTKWSAYPSPWRDTKGQNTSDPTVGGWYYPEKVVSISGGVLNKWLHTENLGGVDKHLVTALVPKVPGTAEHGQSYGRYAIRFKADSVAGYKTAWLLWPDSDVWPRDGEIDFPEGDLNSTIHAFMHRQNGTSGGDQDAYSSSATYTSWHTAIIEWLPTRCTFILDGNVIGQSTSRIPNTPMHWVIQTETALGSVQPTVSAESNVQIDWVAVWIPQ